MMSRVGGYGYLEGEGFRAVRMPYLGGRFAMYLFLPDSGSTPRALAGGLDAARWDGWMREFDEREVALTLPRFTWRGGMDLAGPLLEMGMRRAFGRADFGGMLEPAWLAAAPGRRVFIEGVVQQAFVEVTEEGTEAAAVTEIPMAMDSVVTPPPTPFVADRPFLFAVRDDRTGALLFIGQVNDPTATGDSDGG
jgi:serpin B